MKVQSKTYPDITRSKKEKIVRVPCNVEEVVIDKETAYQYDEFVFVDYNHDIDDTTHWNARAVESDGLLTSAKDFANNLTFADVNNHIDTVFSNLADSQKTSLKKLYIAVLFLLKKKVAK